MTGLVIFGLLCLLMITGMPISIAEAMASGCYVIGRKAGNSPSYIGDAGVTYSSVDQAVAQVRRTGATVRGPVSPLRVTTLTTAKKALSPYKADPGPGITSMRSTARKSRLNSWPTRAPPYRVSLTR